MGSRYTHCFEICSLHLIYRKTFFKQCMTRTSCLTSAKHLMLGILCNLFCYSYHWVFKFTLVFILHDTLINTLVKIFTHLFSISLELILRSAIAGYKGIHILKAFKIHFPLRVCQSVFHLFDVNSNTRQNPFEFTG